MRRPANCSLPPRKPPTTGTAAASPWNTGAIAIANVRNENLFRFTFSLANIGVVRKSEKARTTLLKSRHRGWYHSGHAAFDSRARGRSSPSSKRICAAWAACLSPIPAASIRPISHGPLIAILGNNMLAVIADSASLARTQLADALAFANEQGIPVEVISTSELDRPEYARNDGQRCFQCKDELFTVMENLRAASRASIRLPMA